MSNKKDIPDKKKLFDFEDSEVGIRSVSLLKDYNIAIPTSKWEITPRTATQSKKLKWDQTPFGVIKIESEKYEDGKIKSENGFQEDQKTCDFLLNKTLTMEEINMILPREGYTVYNVWDNEEIEEIDFKLFNDEEKVFFSPLNESDSEDVKRIYKGLYILKRGKAKRVLKIFKGCADKKLALEKIILFCFTFDLSVREKEIILKSINTILEYESGFYTREIFYILSKFSNEETLEEECRLIFSQIFERGYEDFKQTLENEMRESEKETRDLISKLLAIGVYHFGFKKFIPWFKNVAMYGKSKEKMIVLNSLIVVVKKLGIVLRVWGADLLNMVEFCMVGSVNYIKTNVGYLLCLLIEKGIIDNTLDLLKRILKMHLVPGINIYNQHFLPEKKEVFGAVSNAKCPKTWLKSLSYFSQHCSDIILDLIKRYDLIDKSTLKLINNILKNESSEQTELFICENLDVFFVEDNFKNLLFCFKKCSNSEALRSKVAGYLLDSKRSNLVVEVISSLKNPFYLNEEFYENLYIALKNTEIKRPTSLRWIFRTRENVSMLKDLFLSQTRSLEKRLYGFYYLSELIDSLDLETACRLANVVWEGVENLSGEVLSSTLNFLRKIYRRKPFKSFDEIVYLCSMKLKKEERHIKKAVVKFLLTVIKGNVEGARNFNKIEYIRICYEVTDMLVVSGKTSRQSGIELMVEISKNVNVQDVVDILLIKLYKEDNYRGIIEALSHISSHFGFFYVLPKLIFEYQNCQFPVKLRILKLIREFIKFENGCEDKYLQVVIALVEDSVLDREIEMRKAGLKLVCALAGDSKIDTKVIVHLLNVIWFCVLDERNDLFKECWKGFIKTLRGDILMKYLLQGLYHPSKKVKRRYRELFNILRQKCILSECLPNLTKM
ncbi:U2 snRNP component prp10 [Nosema granulosis]|uniref:U2 snRNP component prp10 n=1 Tax=Nosema granulosis TaxID=83296 RepID=A0A9P6H0U4_9MICR|nr:U2 snRNP component prp10 [Nosema granulosis]